MTKEEILNQLKILNERNSAILNVGEAEKRMLKPEESTELENNRVKLRSYREMLKAFPSEAVPTQETGEARKKSEISLTRALREARNAKQGKAVSDEFRSLNDAGRQELQATGHDVEGDLFLPNLFGEERSVNVTTPTQGGHAVVTDKTSILSPLMNDLVLAKSGATILTGLRGDLVVPSIDGITATWEGENAETNASDPNFGIVTLKPKRLSVVVKVSDTWLAQDSVGADNALRRLITDRIREKLESTCLGTAAGSATQPEGLFNATNSTDAVEATWKNVVLVESELMSKNTLPNCYIMHPKLMSIFKTVPKGLNQAGFIINENSNTLNSYPFYATNSVAGAIGNTGQKGYGLLCANMRDYYIGMWNNVSIKVDPYTLAGSNQTRLIINFYVDAKKVRDNSFYTVAMKDAAGGFPAPTSLEPMSAKSRSKAKAKDQETDNDPVDLNA